VDLVRAQKPMMKEPPKTEADWIECKDPTFMWWRLEHPIRSFLDRVLIRLHYRVAKRPSTRKIYLYCCACARRVWQVIQDTRLRQAIETAELFADGLVAREKVTFAGLEVEMFDRFDVETEPESDQFALVLALGNPTQTSHAAAQLAGWAARRGQEPYNAEVCDAEYVVQASLLRCIFGNPFRPVTVSPAWQTANVLELARTIYDERAFDRMPILADALEEAGCTNREILSHCRGAGPHVRGCWVVDLLLGKE